MQWYQAGDVMETVDGLTLAQPQLATQRGLSVVLVQYDRRRYPGALQRLQTHLELLASESWSLVAVDNADSGDWERELAPRVSQIGGDNESWEFSGLDRGIDWLARQGRLTDLVLLVTDAFGAYGEQYLGWFDQALIDSARRDEAVIGWVDSFGRQCSLDAAEYECWLRTSFLLLPSSCLLAVQPLAWPLVREEIFSGDPGAPWRPDSIVGVELREAIEGWLVEGRSAEAGLSEGWHSSFALNAESLDYFELKAMAILREHHLSLRIRASGTPCFDLRLSGLRALQSCLAHPTSGEQWLRGVEIFAEATAAAEWSGEGPRLLVGADLWTPENVAFVRWVAIQVAPWVRQREARFVIEIVGPAPPAPVRVLETLGLARLSAPGISAADPVALVIVPSGSEFNAARLSGEAGPAIAVLEAEWREPRKRRRAALALAERVVDALRSPRATVMEPSGALGSVVEPALEESGPPPLEPVTMRSSADYRRWQRIEAEEATRRAVYERSLVKSSEPFLVEAWCFVCRRQTGQHVDFEYFGSAETMTPNWRERMVCQSCGLNAKSRAVLHILAEVVVPQPGTSVLVCEDRSSLGAAVPLALPQAVVTETFSDLEQATAFEPVDSLLVLDVLSTVDDLPATALVCERTVAPGGALVFTVPFRTDRERTIETTHDGGLEREFGWDVLELFRDAGFEDVAAQFAWSSDFGYLGGTVVVFTARKASAVA